MASPSASNAGQQSDTGKISFRFCRECSNMLYPKEDKVNNQLMFACRTCQFSEPAPSACVFRNDLAEAIGETAGVIQDVGSDPTLPRTTKTCPKCSENEAVFFQSQVRTALTGMSLFFVCCSCGHMYKEVK